MTGVNIKLKIAKQKSVFYTVKQFGRKRTQPDEYIK